MVNRISVSQWAKAGLVAVVVAAWPTYALLDREPGGGARYGRRSSRKLDYTLKDMNGNEVRARGLQGPPARHQFLGDLVRALQTRDPVVRRALVDKYKDQNLTVLGISTDDAPEDLRAFAAEYKMNYPVLVGLGKDELLEAYEAEMLIPVTWFIRRDGTVALKHRDPDRRMVRTTDQGVVLIAG